MGTVQIMSTGEKQALFLWGRSLADWLCVGFYFPNKKTDRPPTCRIPSKRADAETARSVPESCSTTKSEGRDPGRITAIQLLARVISVAMPPYQLAVIGRDNSNNTRRYHF